MFYVDGLSLKVERQRRLERIKQKQSQLQELILQVMQRLPWRQRDCCLVAWAPVSPSSPLHVFGFWTCVLRWVAPWGLRPPAALVSKGGPGRAVDAQGGSGGRRRQVWVRVNRASFQQIAFKNLVERNRRAEQQASRPPPANSAIRLPFIIVNTSKKTVIDCSISNDK